MMDYSSILSHSGSSNQFAARMTTNQLFKLESLDGLKSTPVDLIPLSQPASFKPVTEDRDVANPTHMDSNTVARQGIPF